MTKASVSVTDGDSSIEPRTPNLEPQSPTFRRLYIAVLVNLALLIAIFYAFTKAFE